MNEIIAGFLLISGSAFLLLAGVGVVRMPDLYSRIQAAAKASTLGTSLFVLALAVYFNDFGISIRALLVIAFLYLTVPISGHVIGRTAYFIGIPMVNSTDIDELQGHYDRETHELE